MGAFDGIPRRLCSAVARYRSIAFSGRPPLPFRIFAFLPWCLLVAGLISRATADEPWARWRGPQGQAVSAAEQLPLSWSKTDHVRWVAAIDGEGASSPIVWGNRVFLTAAYELGARRELICLDRGTGRPRWKRQIQDDSPEYSSAITGHAAATPVTDGRYVVAFFGNAGVVCYGIDGTLKWHRSLGQFQSELGLASSPILVGDRVILVCDHDGNRFRSFDSYLIALHLESGETVWKTERPKLFRSWSTPIVVPAAEGHELVVNAQDELRGYDPATGAFLWKVAGMTGWVTPSPVFRHGLIFAASGKDGPTMAVRPGGRGDITESHVVWSQLRGAPYVCSPLAYGDYVYVHNETGVLCCYEALTGREVYRQRMGGKFTASAIAGCGRVYLTNEAGQTLVIRAGPEYELLARNPLDEECVASPAVADNCLLLRTLTKVYCIEP